MKDPQIVSIAGENPDAALMISGYVVIDDTTQVPIGVPTVVHADITAAIALYDVTAGAAIASIAAAAMEYNEASDFWNINLSSGTPALNVTLIDRHKYVARITGDTNMRGFQLEEFAVDNGSFEETLMRLPFQVEIGTPSWMVWYDSLGPATSPRFKAQVYEGGTGVVDATEASKVTHRGPIISY